MGMYFSDDKGHNFRIQISDWWALLNLSKENGLDFSNKKNLSKEEAEQFADLLERSLDDISDYQISDDQVGQVKSIDMDERKGEPTDNILNEMFDDPNADPHFHFSGNGKDYLKSLITFLREYNTDGFDIE